LDSTQSRNGLRCATSVPRAGCVSIRHRISRHVIYLEADASGLSTGIIFEGYCGSDDQWHFKNLTGEANAPQAAAAPMAYPLNAEKTQHVLYRAEGSEHIHELYWKSGDGWRHSDLMTSTSGAPDISGQPFGWEFAGQYMQNVVYMGLDLHVHLLSRAAAQGINNHLCWSSGRCVALGETCKELADAWIPRLLLHRIAKRCLTPEGDEKSLTR
jgi:hypothetical protein